ncbi:hypothetical protein BB559_006952 [Furculomyces boomerangus]|uniref:Mitochondrial intermembrane space import and assembly protein 40 n=2 Tax=Harpellales TaxID=61421 RepID=A0A2T9XZS8_9FUNG|nr:hypothetical protein BB559_006952 [Furculomyces boomerangus]PWA01275.1 hypothetical protein BB558_002647 [Smittium angustum]
MARETEIPIGFEDNSNQEDYKNDQDLTEEEKAAQAFDPETGEINWDCPCLNGMAYGTCGEEFRAAFSCFVYSKEEQKGIDCIDSFKAMQDCFRAHPEEYGSELVDNENDFETPPENDTEDPNQEKNLDSPK